jgi:hypothetical protein
MDKYTYKDFSTGKIRWTRGKFSGWQRGGPLNAWYAVFQNPRGAVLVPEYCLTLESKAAIPFHTRRSRTNHGNYEE